MKLNVAERLQVLELLPQEGKYAALKALRKARETISLTPQEIKEINYVEAPAPAGRGVVITWDVDKEKVREIPFDEYITTVIRDVLVKMDKENKLNERTFSLYEKFVINYNTIETAIK